MECNYVVSNPGPTDPPLDQRKLYPDQKTIGAWAGPNWLVVLPAMPVHSKTFLMHAILKPEDYNLKFEVNTLKPYNGN